MDLQYYIPNGEFDLLATPAFRKSTTFLDETYVELYFHMHLKRRTMYYGLNWIVPSILISLSNILGFTMPPECGEKITLREVFFRKKGPTITVQIPNILLPTNPTAISQYSYSTPTITNTIPRPINYIVIPHYPSTTQSYSNTTVSLKYSYNT